MRNHNSYQGKVYRVVLPADHGEGQEAVRQHMVVVVGKSHTPPHWLKVVTITKSFSPKVGENLYIPIAPSPINRTNMRLHFCDDLYEGMGLPFDLYLQVNKVHQVPQYTLCQNPRKGRYIIHL
ncbi:hypothetical protein V8C35DRAFT_326063 [Trichoderma chlorosporum]